MNFNGNEIKVIDKGEGWVAVFKPSGISVHNEKDKDLISLSLNIIEKAGIKKDISYDPSFGLNPVHRLDKDTSGTLILACRKSTFRFLTKQFEDQTVDKYYTALVHGNIENKGWHSWKIPLSKQAGGRKNIKGKGKRVNCETLYRVKENFRHYTLLEIRLKTGRKHQIRKHAALSRHPVVFDERYGSGRSLKFLRDKFPGLKLCLHSYHLSFKGEDGLERTVTINELPERIEKIIISDKEKNP